MERRKISTGSQDFDKWLLGGYEKEIITTLYGPAGSSKTNLCLMAAASQAALGKKVIFVDTEGGLSIERLKQLTKGNINAIKNILLLKATNFSEQQEAFDKLLEIITKDKKTGNIGLIIVDSMVMLYRLELGQANQKKDQEKVFEINKNLAKQMGILNEIARKKEIPIMITNQVYSKFLSKEEIDSGKPQGVSMVGGDILKYWSKCIIELQNAGLNRKKAILKKHRSLPEKEFNFMVYDLGIKEKRFRLF